MHLASVRMAIDRQVRSRETNDRFQGARDRRLALLTFEDAPAVLEFLSNRREELAPARSAVTRALLEELQQNPHPCWPAILLAAFFPCLLRIRRNPRLSDVEDGNNLIIASFIEAAGTLPLSTQGQLAVINLVYRTRKIVLTRVRREEQRLEVEELLEPEAIEQLLNQMCPSPSAEQMAIEQEEKRARSRSRVRARVRELCGRGREHDLALVLETHGANKPLVDWVRDRHPHADQHELERHTNRLRRRRRRVIARIRGRCSSLYVFLSRAAVCPALLSTENNENRPRHQGCSPNLGSPTTHDPGFETTTRGERT